MEKVKLEITGAEALSEKLEEIRTLCARLGDAIREAEAERIRLEAKINGLPEE